jgi:hypothetical protein
MYTSFILLIALVGVLFVVPVEAALIDQIKPAFRVVWGRDPTQQEYTYWTGRVQRGEKRTYDALIGAMYYQKARANQQVAAATSIPAAGGFEIDKKYYPSPFNPNFLPEGTLIKSASNPAVYYVKGGKKSWVLPRILDVWLGENHFYKHDIITTVSDADLARYPQTSSVNKLYIGKVLQHPNGTQYYIDDKLRKRQISAAVRTALKFPGGNSYPTSAAHLSEFKTGPALTRTDVYPGGMVIYDGPFRGGRIWKIEEAADGTLTKRLYLSDYLYEADGYPDESQRVAVNATQLARHPRASNIERYADGWVVGIESRIYVVQNGHLRLITSPQLFANMGYKQKYVLKVFPEFLRRYPQSNPIAAFKNLVAGGTTSAQAVARPAPSAAVTLTKVRPHIRTLINRVNDIALPYYDRELTVAENKFWVDYLYNGETNNEADLKAAMQRAAKSGILPNRTSRTAELSEEALENKWFPYLFYFVHQKEPNDAERNYWFSRIHSGDRNTIEKLGGTLQWLKDTSGQTHK